MVLSLWKWSLCCGTGTLCAQTASVSDPVLHDEMVIQDVRLNDVRLVFSDARVEYLYFGPPEVMAK